jgi:isoquinoline 1-oxidoreductase
MNSDFPGGFEPERYELDQLGSSSPVLPRRDFFKHLGGGIVVLLCAGPMAGQESGSPGRRSRGRGAARPRELSAWIHINADGAVTVFTGKVEVGQNIRTALTQIVSEELHTAMSMIHFVMGDTDLVPPDAGTFGSRSTPDMGGQLRKVAATAREVLLDFAAEQWKAARSEVTAEEGKVWKKDRSASLSFGALAQDKKFTAMVRDDVPVTEAAQWQVAGKAAAKVNGIEIVTGRHQYTVDQKLPGLLRGKILRPERFGAKPRVMNTAEAEKMEGVQVVRDGDFVGLMASDEFAAARALKVIKAEWTSEGGISNKELAGHLKSTAGAPKELWANSVDRDPASGAVKLTAAYTVAYIAHAPLEPRAAVAQWKGDKLTVWTGTQRPFGVRTDLANTFGIPENQVRVIVPDTGSGYGGKHTGEAAIEAARLAKAVGKPVKLVWTREEEFTWAYFRPAGVIEVRASARADGALETWEFHNYNSGNSGIRTLYEVPNPKTEFHAGKSPLRQGSYRGLAATANHFARESAMDELAHGIKMDPMEFRLKNAKDPRLRAVIQSVAKAFGWPRATGSGGGCGISAGSEKGSYLATCAEVVLENRRVRVLNVVQAFECGAIVNPGNLKNQNEGAIMMGIGAALREEILFENGKIKNARFSEYAVPRFSDTPAIEIVLVNRTDLPSAGAGETPIVGIAPAIANAVFQATGVRSRSMPIGPITASQSKL